MDRSDLKRIFQATAIVSVLVAASAATVSFTWSARYAAVATLALLNWIALAKILGGIAEKKVMDLFTGFSLKPFLLVFLLILAKNGGIEITSFLAGMNTFFLVVFGYIAFKSYFRNSLTSLSGAEAHG